MSTIAEIMPKYEKKEEEVINIYVGDNVTASIRHHVPKSLRTKQIAVHSPLWSANMQSQKIDSSMFENKS